MKHKLWYRWKKKFRRWDLNQKKTITLVRIRQLSTQKWTWKTELITLITIEIVLNWNFIGANLFHTHQYKLKSHTNITWFIAFLRLLEPYYANTDTHTHHIPISQFTLSLFLRALFLTVYTFKINKYKIALYIQL